LYVSIYTLLSLQANVAEAYCVRSRRQVCKLSWHVVYDSTKQ